MLVHCAHVLSKLPLGVHYRFADWCLYPMMYHMVRYRRKIVSKNIALSFPDKTEKERRRIAKAFYRQFCYTIVESIYGFGITNEQMQKRVVFENMDEVNRLVKEAGGAIFMLAHMGNWEWLASVQGWLQEGVTEMNVYRPLKNKGMDRLMLAVRSKRGGVCVAKQRILREMVQYRAEKKPVTVGLISDQKPRPEVTRTWTTFLHQETGFLDGGEMLGKKFEYPVFYAYVTREKKGYYRVQMQLISATPQLTEEGQITEAYASMLEENIQEQPFMWLWSHNRWKWSKGEKQMTNGES